MKIILILAVAVLMTSGCICCGSLGGEEDVTVDFETTSTLNPTTLTETTSTLGTTTILETTTSLEETTTTTQDESTTTTTLKIECSKVKPSERLDCYISEAQAAEDITVCDKVTNYNEELVCKAVYQNNPEDCKAITSSPDKRDLCYKKLAILNQNEDLCDFVRSPNKNTECILKARG